MDAIVLCTVYHILHSQVIAGEEKTHLVLQSRSATGPCTWNWESWRRSSKRGGRTQNDSSWILLLTKSGAGSKPTHLEPIPLTMKGMSIHNRHLFGCDNQVIEVYWGKPKTIDLFLRLCCFSHLPNGFEPLKRAELCTESLGHEFVPRNLSYKKDTNGWWIRGDLTSLENHEGPPSLPNVLSRLNLGSRGPSSIENMIL